MSEVGQEALPAVDIGDDAVVIGSGAAARIRLPVHAARDAHVQITGARWTALAEVRVMGDLQRAGDSGDIATGVTFQLGEYRVRVSSAPAGVTAAPPQRTESLARELVRGLLGTDSAPTLEIERGPVAGIKRALPPPEATLVIGRGEEATWIVIDEDLSRTHAEVHRGWDGVTIRDLGSKNGTKLDGTRITAPTLLRDGVLIELGKVALRFRDPAERHLRGEATAAATPRAVHAAKREPAPPPPASSLPFVIATLIAGLAIAGLVWILGS